VKMSMLTGRFARAAAAAPAGCCAACRHRVEHRDALEERIPGLMTFSSGFGASVADSRLCRLHDQLVSPRDCCARFEPGGRTEGVRPR